MEMFDLRGDCRPGNLGESAIDERGSGNKPPKGDEVKRKIDMGLHNQKGVEHALSHICDSLNFVAVRISRWLCGWWTHSYPAGRCHHRVSGPTYSGTKNSVAILTR
jgi:hypothetical protein